MLVCLSFLSMPTYPWVCFPGEGACQPSRVTTTIISSYVPVTPLHPCKQAALCKYRRCDHSTICVSWLVSVSVEKKKKGVGKQREWNLHVVGSVLWIFYLAVLFCSSPIIHVAFNWSVQSNSICATALPAEKGKKIKEKQPSQASNSYIWKAIPYCFKCVSPILCLWQICWNIKKQNTELP